MNEDLLFNLELNHVMELLSQCLSPMEQLQCYLSGQQGYLSQESEVRPQEKRILRCPAEGCGKVFRSSPGYRYHLKSHASDPRPHQCRCCMKKFKSANGLKYHLRKSHSIEPVASKAKAAMAADNNENTNGNEDSESTGDDDCVVPSLPPEQLLSKNSPQQHESVIRMNHSLTNFKTEQTFKSEPSLSFRSDCDAGFKNELPRNNNVDSNNNNNDYTRHSSYEDTDSICYGSQAESGFRYSSYPEINNLNNRYGIEGSGGRYNCSDETETVRLGCQSYNPKPSYRDHYRENFRESLRSDYSERRTSMQDYQYRSIMPQDRYSGVMGYARSDPQSRYTYPRFDYSSRSYGMSKVDLMKSELFLRNHSQYDNRNDFHKSNDTFFRNPNDCVSRNEHVNMKSDDSVSRNPLSRNSTMPKSSSDAFVKPTFSRNDYVTRLNSSENEFSHKFDKVNSSGLSNGRIQLQDNRFPGTVIKTECVDKDSKQDSPSSERSLPKTDINGNSVIESTGILKRRSSKPIPPALVIEPPASSGDEKKDEDSKILPPEVNRLTEFAEFAISPQSPLVQSPFPLTLTPGLLGAGSTPDWMTKSFTRFFFPDKPHSYLNTSGLSTSRHNQEEDEMEGRTVTSSLPPSPFIDNVSTPQPFWTTQAWPTPVWHCFVKGCSVKFDSKDEDFRRVEDIACCNSLLNKRNDEANYGVNGLKVIEIKEIKDIIINSKVPKDRVMITFDSTTPGEPKLLAKCPVDHLFLVKLKGWSSPRPNEAMTRYGIPFQCLQKGDICIPSAQHKETNSNTLSPLVSCTEAFVFNAGDNSAANALSSMAKRQELSVDRPSAISLMSASSISASSPAADSVSSTTTAAYSPGEVFPKDVPYSMVLSMDDQSATRTASQNSKQPQEMKKLPNNKKGKRKRKTNNLEEKQRRPMNGFMLFAKKMRIELTQKFPGKDNRAISKVLGEQWRALSTSERQDFATRAKVMADERRKINPDCWKRKRKKSKGAEAEIEVEDMRIKTEYSPGSCHSKDNIFSMG